MHTMHNALYNALYKDYTAFQWVHFTKHGIVKGRLSREITPTFTNLMN